MKLYIDFSPREWQKWVLADSRRWKVIVAHRRSGKTHLALAELIRSAIKIPESRYAYIAPTYKQAKAIAWDILKKMAKEITSNAHESELRITLINGSIIRLYWADNPDSLRGIALWWVVYDEYSQHPAFIHSEIIRPALSDHEGWAIWIWTPKGRNIFYHLYKHSEANTKDWYSLLLQASQSKLIPEKELLEAKGIMSIEEYNQEFQCSFDSAIRWAYYAQELHFISEENRIRDWVYDPFLPVSTFWDLGISDYTSIVFAQFTQGKVLIVDYFEDNGKPLSHYAWEILSKRYKYDCHYLPHDWKVRDLGTWVSREDMLRSSLHNIRIVPEIWVKNGIEATRQMLNFAYFEASKTERLRDMLAMYTQEFDKTKWMFKDNPKHDESSHCADATRMLWVMFKQLNDKPKYDWNPVEQNVI